MVTVGQLLWMVGAKGWHPGMVQVTDVTRHAVRGSGSWWQAHQLRPPTTEELAAYQLESLGSGL